jgi:hypothetical protein
MSIHPFPSVARTLLLLASSSLLVLAAGCGDDSGGSGSGGGTSTSSTGSPDETGKQCSTPDECYPDVADGQLAGEALCLDRVRGGYCTHECESDEDCCKAEGECKTDLTQVCSPFESTDTKMCFLACEDEDIGQLDEQTYCQREASRDFICRSSGGGSENRKICVPGDCGVGAACAATADCSGDLECITGLTGGYCTRRDCTADSGCPDGTRCVEQEITGDRYCLRTCAGESDCSFCRGDDLAASCTDGAQFVEGSPESVCIPPEF